MLNFAVKAGSAISGQESSDDVPQGLIDVLPCFGAISPQLFVDISRKFGRYNEAVLFPVDLSRSFGLSCGHAGLSAMY